MIDNDVAELGFDRIGGIAFEKYFHALGAAIYGPSFVPLGGTNDGGADAFAEPIFGIANRFYQASTQSNFRDKIRRAYERITAVGRTCTEIVYFTSRQVARTDQEETDLSDELGVTVRIRDQRWLVVNVNYDDAAIQAFRTYVGPEVQFLQHIGAATVANEIPDASLRTLFVFLQQELSRRQSNADLLVSITDSLILWSLEGTDPDRNIFLSRNDILGKIEGVLPSAKHFVRGEIDKRLTALSSKDNDSGREVRYHRLAGGFCLPYETRLLVEAENARDEVLKKHVLAEFQSRAEALVSERNLQTVDCGLVAGVCNLAVEKAFEAQGLEIAAFIADTAKADDPPAISDHVDKAIEALAVPPRECVEHGLRAFGVFHVQSRERGRLRGA